MGTSLLNNNHSIHQTTVFDIQVSQYDVWNYQIYSSAAARFVRRDSKLHPDSHLLTLVSELWRYTSISGTTPRFSNSRVQQDTLVRIIPTLSDEAYCCV